MTQEQHDRKVPLDPAPHTPNPNNEGAGPGRVTGKARGMIPVEVVDEDGKKRVEMLPLGVRGRGHNGRWRKPRDQND